MFKVDLQLLNVSLLFKLKKKINKYKTWVFFFFKKRAGGQHGAAANVQRHTVPGIQTHYQMESLSTSTQTTFYEIWVTATNRAGVGDKSKVLRFSPNFKGFASLTGFEKIGLQFFSFRVFCLFS
jgi:hypothetical protein